MGSNRLECGSDYSSRRSSPAPSDSDNVTSFNNLMFGEQQQILTMSGGGCFGASQPEAGWAKPALAANQQPTCEAGMWSPQNPTGTPLQGWDCDKGDLFAFAHFNSMCEPCEQVVRCSMSSEQSSCISPAYLASRDRWRFGDNADGLICCNRPTAERCYALEVLATLVEVEDWTLRGVLGRQAEYLDCLRFYLNQQFLKLVEQGKVLQCFDETGRAVWICFCTGLHSFKGEYIFCVLQRTCAPSVEISLSWHFTRFVTSRELQETRQPWNALEPVLTPPEKAKFFSNRLETLYFANGEGENIQLDPQIWDALEGYLPFFPKSLVNSSATLQARKQAVTTALERIVQKLESNPSMAVPQFQGLSSKSAGALQLLLPMQLDPDADITHLALVLEISKSRRGGHVYRGTGMISLPQAYANARVVMPVSQRWLSSCAFTYDLTCILKGYSDVRRSRSAKDHYRPNLGGDPKPRSILSAPASFNVDESLSRTYAGPSENWVCISQPSAVSQRGGGSLSSQTTPDSSSPISPSASGLYGAASPMLSMYAETSTSNSAVPFNPIGPPSHHQVSFPPSHSAAGNGRRTYVDIHGERKSVKGTGVIFPMYSEPSLQGSPGASSSRFASSDEAPACTESFVSFQRLSMMEKERVTAPESQSMTSLSPGGESSKQTSGYQTMADLGGFTWGVSSSSPSLCPPITSDLNGGCMGSASDLPLSFLQSSTMTPDYIAQSRQVAAASPANYDITRLGPLGVFQAHTGLDLPAICADLDENRQDEYVEFTAADNACPKVNISQLPLRFVADFLSADLPGFEQNAELHTSQVFGRYGMVARSLVRQNKNHSGKWFAIVEFTYWTDESVRLQLIQGSQIRFPDFYGHEDVVFRRHKDKHKKQFCTPAITPGGSCRPFWRYTGTDTRSGKPLFKGPCSQCGKESTVPFKPVVNGQPPRCRNCLPTQQAIPVAVPVEILVGQQMCHMICS